MRRLRAIAWITAGLLTTVALALALTLWWSQPILEGRLASSGLEAPVLVQRDATGHVTIEAHHRRDAAYATGFVHAQEQFLSMDIRRRLAAGELAALLGPIAIEPDQRHRPHRFRAHARRLVGELSPHEAETLRAYTQGVNDALEQAVVWPFPYSTLLIPPEPWRMEDSLLNQFAMYLILQSGYWKVESAVGALTDVFDAEVAQFLRPDNTHYDAPLDGRDAPFHAKIPSPEQIDLRHIRIDAEQLHKVRMHWEQPGSNALAVGHAHTTHSGALLANDMHLALLVPNIWFRMHLQWQNAGVSHMASGLTLPGGPWLIAGSNGHIAWGFTNSNIDTQDLIMLGPDDAITYEEQPLEVRFAPDRTVRTAHSAWGPIIDEDANGRPRALHWVAYALHGEQIHFHAIEQATDTRSALQIFQRSSTPTLNVLVVDRQGNLGWTLAGPILARKQHRGNRPVESSARPDPILRLLAPDQYPLLYNPPAQRLWSANQRHIGGPAYRLLGNGRYVFAARARQIRERLFAKETFTETDLLALQLDTRADYLTEWQQRLNRILDHPSIRAQVQQHHLREVLADWNGHADADSVGYRLLRTFRKRTHELFLLVLQTAIGFDEPDRHMANLRWQLDGPLTQLIEAEARHFLPENLSDWDAFMAEALQITIAEMTADSDLAQATWGQYNHSRIHHPLSHALSWLGPWLDPPVTALSGDLNLPKVVHRGFGAAARMTVAPGREDQGILQMAAGQSGHPLSPFYNTDHDAWLTGRVVPFLPGVPRYTLELVPSEHR